MKEQELIDIWAILVKYANGPENHKPLREIVEQVNRYLYSPDEPEMTTNKFQTVVKPALLNSLKLVVGTHHKGIYACTQYKHGDNTREWYQNRRAALQTNLAKIEEALLKL